VVLRVVVVLWVVVVESVVLIVVVTGRVAVGRGLLLGRSGVGSGCSSLAVVLMTGCMVVGGNDTRDGVLGGSVDLTDEVDIVGSVYSGVKVSGCVVVLSASSSPSKRLSS